MLISDYCKSSETPSPEFSEYIKQRGYDLHDVQAYGQVCFSLSKDLIFFVVVCQTPFSNS